MLTKTIPSMLRLNRLWRQFDLSGSAWIIRSTDVQFNHTDHNSMNGLNSLNTICKDGMSLPPTAYF
jgi:hypothetical protein